MSVRIDVCTTLAADTTLLATYSTTAIIGR